MSVQRGHDTPDHGKIKPIIPATCLPDLFSDQRRFSDGSRSTFSSLFPLLEVYLTSWDGALLLFIGIGNHIMTVIYIYAHEMG